MGWSAGAWYNLPLGFGLSLEPQLQYRAFNSSITADAAGKPRVRPFLDNATVGFITAPLVLKVHIGRFAALTLGGQVDYALRVGDTPNYWTTDSLSAVTFAGSGGVELFPHSRVVLYGRYVRGLSDLSPTGSVAPLGIRAQSVQAGIKVRLAGRRVYADQDGDGLRDKDDKCPTVIGLAKYQGCVPDADRDGVLDEDDACPKEAGVAANRGCAPPPPPPPAAPVLDRDQDGVLDANDRCPTTAGSQALGGCPDGDNDGVEDAVDKCPKAAGTAVPRGCPRLTGFVPSDVTFEGATARLTPAGRAQLDKVTAYLVMYPNVSAEFVGHLDNLGSIDSGIGLSVRRAEAARDFVSMQGIALERLSIRGEGGRRPATSNRTSEGRMSNRRIEVILR
ncbi:MAG: OmpA family protein [Gemmatimonadota bacterium]|nr:OmpA family protein [Gemmatimonadota bacterium]